MFMSFFSISSIYKFNICVLRVLPLVDPNVSKCVHFCFSFSDRRSPWESSASWFQTTVFTRTMAFRKTLCASKT